MVIEKNSSENKKNLLEQGITNYSLLNVSNNIKIISWSFGILFSIMKFNVDLINSDEIENFCIIENNCQLLRTFWINFFD